MNPQEKKIIPSRIDKKNFTGKCGHNLMSKVFAPSELGVLGKEIMRSPSAYVEMMSELGEEDLETRKSLIFCDESSRLLGIQVIINHLQFDENQKQQFENVISSLTSTEVLKVLSMVLEFDSEYRSTPLPKNRRRLFSNLHSTIELTFVGEDAQQIATFVEILESKYFE